MEPDLATCLRAWRDRHGPAGDVASGGRRRRAPGLRREEVATAAGISVNYLMRLEQGRASAPSPSVVSALARALALDPVETAHLHRVAGHADGTGRVAVRTITPSVQRILTRFRDVPVLVLDPAWEIVAASPLARALLAEDAVGENAARNHFVGPQWVERSAEAAEKYEREIVGDLRLALGRFPDDPGLLAVVAELRAASERFEELWGHAPAALPATARKTFTHPTAGTVTVDCDVTGVLDSDLRLVVWTAVPGSADAASLASLAGGVPRPLEV
ncbi:helix-turn-helix transcriptional regulator [Patulibacter sp.]|uniref:helix-turn-helix transcriptional regulator n=1 Tax=Patulibacter sp. TaxID=1912859 RepID=UPI002722DE52|nr:helix-turn-helix transcriptional regulator [Patulibacter sp.]MDO9407022.1 helix-turn-helix transcriptional regulator [Patulibacter sp.]